MSHQHVIPMRGHDSCTAATVDQGEHDSRDKTCSFCEDGCALRTASFHHNIPNLKPEINVNCLTYYELQRQKARLQHGSMQRPENPETRILQSRALDPLNAEPPNPKP